ncbi:MAG TPA: serpin family protein [Nevskia sp.]|nr:serpin family protein [Nevskia sp.]
MLFAKQSNAFGFELYQRLRTQPGNLVVSPASIMTALAMSWGGARGETAEQMRRALHLEGSPADAMRASGELARQLQDPNRPIKFRIANRLFGERTYPFEQPYLDATRLAYGAPLEALDFKGSAETARRRINAWVEQQTEQRIRDLIPAGGLNAETRLALVNAIYFLGDWASPFKKEATHDAAFFTAAATQKDVPTMHRQDSLRFAQRDGVKALELPYKGGNMSMLLLLPDRVDGIGALEQSLDPDQLEQLLRSLQPQMVRVSLPKFEIDPAASLSLGQLLQGMGMSLAFDPQRADFSGIAQPPDPQDRLYLSKVFHKAFVRVDEKGTEAAAATAVVMERAMAAMRPLPVVEFKADHPFLFFIRDNATGMILFSGRVMEP